MVDRQQCSGAARYIEKLRGQKEARKYETRDPWREAGRVIELTGSYKSVVPRRRDIVKRTNYSNFEGYRIVKNGYLATDKRFHSAGSTRQTDFFFPEQHETKSVCMICCVKSWLDINRFDVLILVNAAENY